MRPCRPIYERVGGVGVPDICVLRDPTFPAKKQTIRVSLGRGTLNTYAKFQGLSLKTAVDIRTFLR